MNENYLDYIHEDDDDASSSPRPSSPPPPSPPTPPPPLLPLLPPRAEAQASLFFVQEIDLGYLHKLESQLQYRQLRALNIDASAIPTVFGIFGKPFDESIASLPSNVLSLPNSTIRPSPPQQQHHLPPILPAKRTSRNPPQPTVRPTHAVKRSRATVASTAPLWYANLYHPVQLTLPPGIVAFENIHLEPYLIPGNAALNPVDTTVARGCLALIIHDLRGVGCCPDCVQKYEKLGWKNTMDNVRGGMLLCRNVQKNEKNNRQIDLEVKPLCIPQHYGYDYFRLVFTLTIYDPYENKTTILSCSTEVAVHPSIVYSKKKTPPLVQLSLTPVVNSNQ